jgi:hypothetical protein
MKQLYTAYSAFVSLEYLPFYNWIEKCFFSGFNNYHSLALLPMADN